jgi:predicted MFS family arabinose efflux permease
MNQRVLSFSVGIVMSVELSPAPVRSVGVFALLAICSGIGVANVYYLQPALTLVQTGFGVSTQTAGWLPAITQASYAMGMLLLAPLGDVIARRRLVSIKAGLLFIALVLAASTRSLGMLAVVNVAVGMLGSIGQDFIPAAAQLAPEESRGRSVGIVTTGLLTGILLSRTLGGWVAQLAGWRAMQYLAAALMLVLLIIAWFVMPSGAPVKRSGYGRLLLSLWSLLKMHSALRLALLVQGLLAVTLGAFWSCLVMVLSAKPFLLGAAAAGSFGVAGAAGALAAPIFGRFADRHGPVPAIRIGCMLVVVAFAGMALLPPSLWIVGAGAVLFDLGVQASLVSHQMIVSRLDPNAGSRTNGLLMTGAMIGMAVGAGLGSLAWAHAGAAGLFWFAAAAGMAAFCLSFLYRVRKGSSAI